MIVFNLRLGWDYDSPMIDNLYSTEGKAYKALMGLLKVPKPSESSEFMPVLAGLCDWWTVRKVQVH